MAAVSLLLALLGVCRWAFADQTGAAGADALDAPSADTGAGSATALQEIVVSANKRVEDIKDVPISITAISGADLLDKRIESYDDIARAVPGVNFNSVSGTEGTTNIEIRGVSSTSGSATTGLYIDDVSITTKNFFYDGAANPRLFDLDRLEVLRGPQGTLYGDSSEGGTIRFITPKPQLTQWTGQSISDYSQTEHGAGNYFQGAVFNAPLIPEVFAVRGSVGFTSDSGFIDHYTNPAQSSAATLSQVTPYFELQKRGVNWDDVFVTRLNGLLQVSDALTISPSFFYQRYKYGDSDAFYPPGQPASLDPLGPPIPGLWIQDKETPEPGLDTLILPSLTVNARLGFADLTSVTGLFLRQYARQIDGTYYNSAAFASLINTPCPAPGAGVITYPNGSPNCDSAQEPQVNSIIANLPSAVHLSNHYGQFSQELRLASPVGTGAALKWVAGLYYENSWIHDVDFQQIPGISTAFTKIFGVPMEDTYVNTLYGPPGAGYSLLFPDDIDESDNRFYSERQFAGFGQIDYDFSPSLHGSLGGRYATTHETYVSNEIGFYQWPNISPYHQEGTFSAFTPKVSLSYNLSTQSSVYTSVAKGFRNGGPTGPIPYGGFDGGVCGPNLQTYGLNAGPTKFNSDSLWTYELGSKNRLDENRLSIDGAVYTTNWKNIQQSLYLPTCGYYFTANVGDAKIYGGELEINYRPVPQLTLGLTADVQHAYISSATNPSEASVGSWLIDVPDYNYSGSAAYLFPLTASASLVSRVDYAYSGSSYGSYQPLDYLNSPPTTNPNYRNPGYGVLNASFGLTGRSYDVSLYAKNLGNDRKIIQQPEVNTVFEAYTVRPRTVGLTLKLRFE
ncbi:MAG TPA: TonB-dependent receptor [Steroidobacteraceae bacterium]|nr:TonB-dependent receptor [Steroidobacteraceae bacterium]